MRYPAAIGGARVAIRGLERDEIRAIWSIDRAEMVERVYAFENGALVLKPEPHDVQGWPEGDPERHSLILLDCFDRGGTFYGAFDAETLIGAVVLESRFIGRDEDQL